jgi:pimeloyl-ACP methyl ester carboxylesterase
VFSETRYAMNGDLRVAYRASREGSRDIVVVPPWFTNCEVVPELPSMQGWVQAMTSLGRLIFFDQPGTGASDPVTAGALPTLEQWADSITAVLDDLGSREAVLLAGGGAFAAGALFAATHPSRTTALVALEVYADPMAQRTDGLAPEEVLSPEEVLAAMVGVWGTGETTHVLNPDMPWNEEIRASWARLERLAASPGTVALMMPLLAELT